MPCEQPLCAVASGRAAELCKRQLEFFRKIDAFIIDEDSARCAGECGRVPDATSAWETKLARDTESLRTAQAVAPPSHTRVIEAAIFLLRCGLLNVKGTPHLNVKQARALMHWAWWLQQQMSQEWVAKGVLGAAPFGIDRAALCHVLTGGAGGGKTTRDRVPPRLLLRQ